MGFTENLNRIMKEKKLKVPALSALSGISIRALTSYTQGQRKAPQDKLEALARALHVSTDELIGLPAAPESLKPETFCSQFAEGSLTHEKLTDGSIRLHSTLAIRAGDVVISGSEFAGIVQEAQKKAAPLCKEIEAAMVMETAAAAAEVKAGRWDEMAKDEYITLTITAAAAAVAYIIKYGAKQLKETLPKITEVMKPFYDEKKAMAKPLAKNKYTQDNTAPMDALESTLDRMSRKAYFESPLRTITLLEAKNRKLEARLFELELEKNTLQAYRDRVLRRYEPGHNDRQYADYKAQFEAIRDEIHRQEEAVSKDVETCMRENIKAGFKGGHNL